MARTIIIDSRGVRTPENLKTYSEDLSGTGWTNVRTSDGQNAGTDPFGGNNANTLTENNDPTTTHYLQAQTQTVVNGTQYAVSAYFKANGRHVRFGFGTPGFPSASHAFFNLTTGEVGTTGGGEDSTSISDAGNGWYRCTVVSTCDADVSGTQDVLVNLADGESISYSGDNSSGIYVFGVQWERVLDANQATPGTYIKTTAKPIEGFYELTNGRLPQNLLSNSKTPDGTVTNWVDLNCVAAADTGVTDPFGGTDAAIVTADSGTVQAQFYRQETTADNVKINSTYTASGYFKAGTSSLVQMVFHSTTHGTTAWASFDLANVSVGNVAATCINAEIESAGNGWYRCSITAKATSASYPLIQFGMIQDVDSTARLPSLTWAGTETLYVCGVQYEDYSTAGDYTENTIPGGNRVLTRLGQNFVFNSDDFSSTHATYGWNHGTNDAQITSNSDAAPDGTTTADTATDSSGSLAEIVQQLQNPLAAGVQANTDYCWSIYIKKTTGATTLPLFATAWGTSSWVYGHIFIDTNDGVAYARSGFEPDQYGIESVGDYWRVWQTTNPGSLTKMYFQFYPAGSSSATPSTFDATLTGSAVIWGAQLEARPDGPGTYTATTTAAVPGVTITRASTATYFDHNGIMQTAAIGEDRTEYDPSDNSLRGLLIEEARTNLLLQSENILTTWTSQGSLETADATIAPDGTLTADKLYDNSTPGVTHYIFQTSQTHASGATTAFSVYAKAGEYDWIALYTNEMNEGRYFNVANGTLGGVFVAAPDDSTIEDVGNGWYRCTIVGVATAATTSLARIYNADADGGAVHDGDGASGVYIWGTMLEVGAAPSSYIPTTTASVTRAADDIKITDLTQIGYNSAAGTLALTYIWPLLPYYLNRRATYFYENGDASADRIIQYMGGQGAKTTVAYGTTGGVQQFAVNDTQALEDSLPHISVMAWATNDIGHTVDGGPVHTDSLATISATIDTLMLGADPTGALLPMNGYIAKLVYYSKRLPDGDLVTLSAGGSLHKGIANLGFAGKVGIVS